MDFIIGAFFGALAMTAAVAVSISYEPYKITECRLELRLEDGDDGDGNA